MLQKTWQRLRLLGLVGAAGATAILQLSSARLLGQDWLDGGFSIGEHG